MAFAITDGELRTVSRLASPTNPYRPWGIAGFRHFIGSYGVIWKTQPNVRTVVDFQARQAGSLTPRLLERVDATTKVDRFDHPLARLLRFPHPRMSGPKFWRFAVADLLVFDVILAVKTRIEGSPRTVALSRITPELIEPVGGDFLTAEGFRVGTGSNIYTWDQVVAVTGYNPADARWGVSPIETIRRILSEEAAAQDARAQFFDRAARMSGWISRPKEAPEWTDPGRKRFNDSWRDRLTGDGAEAGSTPVLEEGMEFHGDTFDAAGVQYLEGRKLSGVEVSRHYHLHPSLLGFIDQPPTDEARRGLIADNLDPLMGYIAAEFALQLLPDFEPGLDAFDRFTIDFDLEGKLRGDFLAEAEATSRATGAPWLLRNEARARRGLPPVPGGDDLVTPLNVTAGGRASPADTAPGTPGLGQAARRAKVKAAIADLRPHAQTWAEQHATIVRTNVARQESRFNSRIGAGYDHTGAFDKTRADNELGDDLAGLALEYADVAAAPLADRFGVEYDRSGDEGWLVTNARTAAGNYNQRTLDALLNAESNGDTELDDDGAAFEDAGGARADSFGLGRVVTIAGFATESLATQAGRSSKTWNVNSDNPRPSHADLDGETVSVGETFDVNGTPALWPGDPGLPAEESAGCTCSVDFG